MTNEQQNIKDRVIVALDIAKSSHGVVIQLVNGKRVNIKIPNTVSRQPPRYQMT